MNTEQKLRLQRYGIAALFLLIFILEIWLLGWPLHRLFVTYIVLALAYLWAKREALRGVQANYYLAAGRADKARAIYKAMTLRNTRYPAIYLNYATMLLRDGQAREALALLQTALTLKPRVLTQKNLLLTLGSCYWVLGEIDKAIDTLEGLRARYEYANAQALTTLGYMYYLKDDLDKALSISEAALADSPDSASAWDNVGQIYFKKGDMDTAREKFQKALACNPGLVDSNYYMGLLAEREGNAAEARTYFETARGCKISALNTVTAAEIAEKCALYGGEGE